MAKKAIRKSNTGALASCFSQLRAHGWPRSPALTHLADRLKTDEFVVVPELPKNWALELDGDKLFVVSPAGRRDAREFVLYENLFKPIRPSPETMRALYPSNHDANDNAGAPAVSPTEPAALISNQKWFDDARKAHHRQRNEPVNEYARRLHILMQKAPVAKPWKSWKTVRRRLYDK